MNSPNKLVDNGWEMVEYGTTAGATKIRRLESPDANVLDKGCREVEVRGSST